MNVVANRDTRRLADRMMRLAVDVGGPEAARQLLPRLDAGQLAALVGILLRPPQHGVIGRRNGRPSLPVTMSPEAMRRGYSQYRQGVRNDFTITAMREYTRENKRVERVRRAI